MDDEAITSSSGDFLAPHTLAMLCGVVSALSAFYHDSLDNDNPEHRIKAARDSQDAYISAMCYKHGI